MAKKARKLSFNAVKKANLSLRELAMLQAELQHEIRNRRVRNVLAILHAQNKDQRLHFLEGQLAREVKMIPQRIVILEDLLDQIECILDIVF